MFTIHVDASIGPKNPGGYAFWGIVVKEDGKEIHKETGYIGCGEGMTINYAEYEAVIEALRWIESYTHFNSLVNNDNDSKSFRIYSDSSLIVNQINGKWKCKNPELQEQLKEVQILIYQIEDIHDPLKFIWIPREKNEEADELVHRAYDNYTKGQV